MLSICAITHAVYSQAGNIKNSQFSCKCLLRTSSKSRLYVQSSSKFSGTVEILLINSNNDNGISINEISQQPDIIVFYFYSYNCMANENWELLLTLYSLNNNFVTLSMWEE